MSMSKVILILLGLIIAVDLLWVFFRKGHLSRIKLATIALSDCLLVLINLSTFSALKYCKSEFTLDTFNLWLMVLLSAVMYTVPYLGIYWEPRYRQLLGKKRFPYNKRVFWALISTLIGVLGIIGCAIPYWYVFIYIIHK